jgi:hypothetical protein
MRALALLRRGLGPGRSDLPDHPDVAGQAGRPSRVVGRVDELLVRLDGDQMVGQGREQVGRAPAGFTGGGDGVSPQVQDPSAEARIRVRALSQQAEAARGSPLWTAFAFQQATGGYYVRSIPPSPGELPLRQADAIVYTRTGCPTRSSEP